MSKLGFGSMMYPTLRARLRYACLISCLEAAALSPRVAQCSPCLPTDPEFDARIPAFRNLSSMNDLGELTELILCETESACRALCRKITLSTLLVSANPRVMLTCPPRNSFLMTNLCTIKFFTRICRTELTVHNFQSP